MLQSVFYRMLVLTLPKKSAPDREVLLNNLCLLGRTRVEHLFLSSWGRCDHLGLLGQGSVARSMHTDQAGDARPMDNHQSLWDVKRAVLFPGLFLLSGVGKRSWAMLGNTRNKALVGDWAQRWGWPAKSQKYYFKASSPAPRPTDKGRWDKTAA